MAFTVTFIELLVVRFPLSSAFIGSTVTLLISGITVSYSSALASNGVSHVKTIEKAMSTAIIPLKTLLNFPIYFSPSFYATKWLYF